MCDLPAELIPQMHADNFMKPRPAWVIAASVLALSGCIGDRTQNMVRTCQSLLETDDMSSDKRFIRDAEKQLATLNAASNSITGAVRDLQDKNAMTYRPQLEECLGMLKSRQPQS